MTRGEPIRLAFLGDISLNDRYREIAAQGQRPFAAVADLLADHHVVVGNLEAMAEGSEGENWVKKPRLRTDPETLELLRDLHLSAVSLAHNHVYDHLRSGFRVTTRTLDDLGIRHWGASLDPTEAAQPLRLDAGGHRVGLLAYVSDDTNPRLPAEPDVHVNIFDPDRAEHEVRALRAECDLLCVYLHWGGKVEGAVHPHPEQLPQARALVDAGADLVVGHHTHTLQPYERHGSGWIYYSLGNFCFADISSDGRWKEIDWNWEACSAILSVRYDGESVEPRLIPIRNRDHFILEDSSFWPAWERRVRGFPGVPATSWRWTLHRLRSRYWDPTLFYFFGNDRSFWRQLRALDPGKVVRFLRG